MLHTEDIIKRAIDAYVSSIDKYPDSSSSICVNIFHSSSSLYNTNCLNSENSILLSLLSSTSNKLSHKSFAACKDGCNPNSLNPPNISSFDK